MIVITQQSEEKARKDKFIQMNEVGVAKFEKGLIEEAKRIFCHALGCLRGPRNCYQTQPYTPNGRENHLEELIKAALNTNSIFINSHMMLHPYVKDLRYYANTLRVHASLPEESLFASLFYNIGQTYLSCMKYGEAIEWFELARGILVNLPKSVNTTGEAASSNAINISKVLNNLGCCAIFQGNLDEALNYYQQALDFNAILGLGTFDFARTLSCIVVSNVLLEESKGSDDNSSNILIEQLKQSLKMIQLFRKWDKDVAAILDNLGHAYSLRSEYEMALATHTDALHIRGKLRGYSIDIAASKYHIGKTYHQMGEMSQALQCYRDFLALGSMRHVPSMSPEVVDVHLRIAQIYYMNEDWETARLVLLYALHYGRGFLGEYHPYILLTIKQLGYVFSKLGNFNFAVCCFEQGIRIEQVHLGQGHPWIMISLRNLAQLNSNIGKHARAQELFRQLCTTQIMAVKSPLNEIAQTLMQMAHIKFKIGEYFAGREMLNTASNLLNYHYGGKDHLEWSFEIHSIGLIYFEHEEYNRAMYCFARSVQMLQRCSVCDGMLFDAGVMWFNLATASFEAGEEELAVEVYAKAIRVGRDSLLRRMPGNRENDLENGKSCSTCCHTKDSNPYVCQYQVLHPRFFVAAIEDHCAATEITEATTTEAERMEALDSVTKAQCISLGLQMNIAGMIYLQRGEIGNMMENYACSMRIYHLCGLPESALVISGLNFDIFGRIHISSPPAA